MIVKSLIISGVTLAMLIGAACSSAAPSEPQSPSQPAPAPTAMAPSSQSPAMPAAPSAPNAPAPAAPAPLAPPPIVPTAFPQTSSPPRRDISTPQPPSLSEPEGSINVAIVDVGPPQYYGYKLTWPYNERNTGLGMYETLIWFDGERLLPQIADSWELDGLKLRLHIRDDVPFHDPAYGNVTTEDVVFTYQNNSKDGTLHTAASPVQRDYVGFDVIDDQTVEFTLREEVVTWPIGPRSFGIESKAMIEDKGEDYAQQNAIGTGPFKLVSHVTDDNMELQAIPSHWRQTPDVATIKVWEVPESATRVAMLRTGEADAIQIDLPLVGQVMGRPGIQFVEGRYGSGTGTSVFFAGQYYQTNHPLTGEPTGWTPFTERQWVGDPNDPASMESARNVRKAFSYAINRQGIIDNILQGRGCLQYQYRIDTCSSVWNDKWATPYNVERAREFMTSAGYADGFDFNFFIPTGLNSTMEEIAEAIVPMWEEAGLRASIDKTAYSARRPTMLDRSISDVWMFIHGGVVSPDGVVQQWHELGGQGVWNMGAAIPGATEIANNVLHEPNWDDAWEKVAEGLDWLAEEQPVAQAVTWRDPIATGGRISTWEMPVHPGRFPVYVENIRLNR